MPSGSLRLGSPAYLTYLFPLAPRLTSATLLHRHLPYQLPPDPIPHHQLQDQKHSCNKPFFLNHHYFVCVLPLGPSCDQNTSLEILLVCLTQDIAHRRVYTGYSRLPHRNGSQHNILCGFCHLCSERSHHGIIL